MTALSEFIRFLRSVSNLHDRSPEVFALGCFVRSMRVVQSLITLKNRQVGLSPGKKAFHHGWQV